MKDFFSSLFSRRVLIPVAIGGLLALFLALYYFVYAPRQQVRFHKSAFRILANITDNFKVRIANYSTAVVTPEIKNWYGRKTKFDLTRDNISDAHITALKTPLPRNVGIDSIYSIANTLKGDSVKFLLATPDSPGFDTSKSIRQILDPIVSIRNNMFESVVLMTCHKQAPDTLLYSSGELAIDREILTDSLYSKADAFMFPKVIDMQVEGIRYKLFLYPFRIDHSRYLMGGFMPYQEYRSRSQDFPLRYLVIIGLLMAGALLSLPFLKIFLIGSRENITIRDVRAILAVLFLVPFLFMLLLSALWISRVEKLQSDRSLRRLHNKVTNNFLTEISSCVDQLNAYDSLYLKSPVTIQASLQRQLLAIKEGDPNKVGDFHLRDVFFYPAIYKNMDGIFWANRYGVEIEKWNFINKVAPYLYLSDRQYFKDVMSGNLYNIDSALPGKKFSIQPTLSKATGNYTVNIVKPSNIKFEGQRRNHPDNQSVLVGMSGKLYSIYKPVVLKGYNFCIVDESGDMLYHSESDRSLQENLFDEAGNSDVFRTAIGNRDRTMVDGQLYDNDIRAMISPVKGLPYYLVTYYNKRNLQLFTLHIISFAFLCEAILLLTIGIFILFFYTVTRKHAKLFFSPAALEWIKPRASKNEYYKALIRLQLLLLAVFLISLPLVPPDERLNFILHASVLLPFSVATGYYMLRSAETYANIRLHHLAQRNYPKPSPETSNVSNHVLNSIAAKWSFRRAWSDVFFRGFVWRVVRILLAYLAVVLLFFVIRDFLQGRFGLETGLRFKSLFGLLILGAPVGTAIASAIRYEHLTHPKKATRSRGAEKHYLSYLSIAVILSIFLVSVLPTTGFLLFASQQEISLQAKAEQMQLARDIQSHRDFVNEKIAGLKLQRTDANISSSDADFFRRLKFDTLFGIYPVRHQVHPIEALPTADVNRYMNSIVYKKITDYLFLPPDHFDFYNNTRDYYWTLNRKLKSGNQKTMDELKLYYLNLSDREDPSLLMISSDIPHNLPLVRRFDLLDGLLFLAIIAGFIFGLYSLIISLSKRIFLIGYFERETEQDQDPSQVNRILAAHRLTPMESKFWFDEPATSRLPLPGATSQSGNNEEALTINRIREKEKEINARDKHYAEHILKIQTMLAPAYERIWKSCTLHEKSVVYDFALDGFTNYRNLNILYSLFRKSIIQKDEPHLRIMTDSFRNFLISKTGSAEVIAVEKKVSQGGKWGNLRAVFYVFLFAIILFLFIVREDVSKRVLAIVTSLAAIIPLLLKLFEPGGREKES